MATVFSPFLADGLGGAVSRWTLDKPRILSHHIGVVRETGLGVNTFAREGPLIYIAQPGGAVNDTILGIVDVSDPLAPRPTGVFRSAACVEHIEVKDSIAFLGAPDSGLIVVDCHNPAAPTRLGRFLDFVIGLEVHDSLLFAIGDSLYIFDISNPSVPIQIGATDCRPTSASSIEMATSEGFVYWAATTFGGIEVSMPTNPGECEEVDYTGDSQGIAALGSVVAIADPSSGVWVLQNSQLISGHSGSNPPLPESFHLFPSFPNPFNPVTTIRFSLRDREHITITVFDVLGQKVADLLDGTIEVGTHEVMFDGKGLSAGVYFVEMRSNHKSDSEGLLLIK